MSLRSRVAALFRPAPAAAPVDPNARYRQIAVYPFFNWLAGVPDPDEVLRRTGRTRADLRQLLRDAEVSQAVDTRRDAVISTPWRLENGAARGMKFVQAELEPIIERLVMGCWDATLYGYSVGETVFAKRGGGIGIADIHFPPFEWFRPLPDGTLRFFPVTGEGGMNGLECDLRKFVLTQRNPNYRNPYGEALLSVLYWPVTWRMQGWQLWLDFLETFSAPIVVGKVANYNAFVEAMQLQGVKRVVGWQPTGNDESVETVDATGKGQFSELNDALNEQIQKCVLGQTLTSSIGKGGGSFAAAKVHDQVREDKRRADVRMISGSVQGVVNALWELNGFPGEPPEFCMQDDVGLEQERADRDAVLIDLGVRFTPEYITERYDLEPEDFTMTDPTPAPPPTAGAAPGGAGLSALLAAARFTPEQQAVERGIEGVLAGLGSAIPEAEIKAAIRLATSPQDLEARLVALLGDGGADFKQVFERALFAADVLGYAHAGPTT